MAKRHRKVKLTKAEQVAAEIGKWQRAQERALIMERKAATLLCLPSAEVTRPRPLNYSAGWRTALPNGLAMRRMASATPSARSVPTEVTIARARFSTELSSRRRSSKGASIIVFLCLMRARGHMPAAHLSHLVRSASCSNAPKICRIVPNESDTGLSRFVGGPGRREQNFSRFQGVSGDGQKGNSVGGKDLKRSAVELARLHKRQTKLGVQDAIEAGIAALGRGENLKHPDIEAARLAVAVRTDGTEEIVPVAEPPAEPEPAAPPKPKRQRKPKADDRPKPGEPGPTLLAEALNRPVREAREARMQALGFRRTGKAK
jgi:hypothetical protein